MKASDMIKPENAILVLLLVLDILFLVPANPVRTAYSSVFILFVPGLAVLSLARKRVGLQEAMALSAAVSIGLGVVLFEVMGFLVRMDSLSVLMVYNTLIIGSYLYSVFRKKGIRIDCPRGKALFALSHLLVLSLPVFLVFNPYISLVSDGWKHVSIVNQMGSLDIPPTDPRIAEIGLVYPWGSHLFMGLSLSLSSAHGLEIYNIFSGLSVLVLFLGSVYLARHFLEEREAILAGLITTAMAGLSWVLLVMRLMGPGIPGNEELIRFMLTYSFSFLATVPFAPLTLIGMGLMAVSIRLFLEYLEGDEPDRLWLGALITGSLLTIEVIPAGVVGLVLFWSFLATLIRSRLSWRKLIPFLKIGLAMIPFLLIFRAVYSSGSSMPVAPQIIIRHGLDGFLMMYGIPLILAVIGTFMVLRGRDSRKYVLVYSLLIFYFVFNHLDFGGLPVFYRFMFYLLLPIGILGSMGLVRLAGYLKGTWRFLLLFLVLSVSFVPVFMGTFIYSNSIREISEDTRQGAEWLAANTPGDSVILTNPYSYHTYVPAFGERTAFLGAHWSVDVYSTIFGLDQTPDERLAMVEDIFNSNDIEHVSAKIEEYGIDYVFLGHHEFLLYDLPRLEKFLDERYFEPVYNKGEVLIIRHNGFQRKSDIRALASGSLEEVQEKLYTITDHSEADFLLSALDSATDYFSSGEYKKSLLVSKIALAESSESAMMSRESSIRNHLRNPAGIMSSFLTGIAYYYLLLLLFVRAYQGAIDG